MKDILDLDTPSQGDDDLVMTMTMTIDNDKGDTETDEGAGMVEELKERAQKRKGRGFTAENPNREEVSSDKFEGITVGKAIDEPRDVLAQRSVEGWILIVTGIHEEAQEDDVQCRFADYGEIKNLHLNLDRRTGFLKGYALIEYKHFKDASAAKNSLDGSELLGDAINVDWAFMKKSVSAIRRSRQQ